VSDPWNAFITRVEPDEPREGPLAGRPLGVKDLFDTAGIRTTYGSGLFRDHVPEQNAVACSGSSTPAL
jgi:Asp-tRNA(Asn)/Glu-tRNA(Gln) amidotransferase A subunit family amidase